MSELVYFEDLQPGMSFTGAPVQVTAEDIKAFAAQFDPQPFHLDETAGAASFFKGFAASGWHTAALGMRMMVNSGPKLAAGYIGAGGEIAWKKPVYAGDTLTLRGEFIELKPSRSRPDRGMAVVRCETFNQHGELVQVMTAQVVVWRRPAS
ncbi:MAG TPA: MaoC family dehydratase [Steroidobacteraceae bacterium]|nr:MaoC family dehydratase [Steroidobacteraceae bacterium]